jgi:hypothetical protein
VTLVEWIAGLPHRYSKGHWPNWYDLGAGERFLVCCAHGGRRMQTFTRARLQAIPIH